MTIMGITFCAVSGLMLAKIVAQLWLENLNRRHVQAHADRVPEVFQGIVDEPTYAKSVQYTLAKARLSRIETVYNAVVLLIVLFSGFLPQIYSLFLHWFGEAARVKAVFLFATGVALSIPDLPFEWYHQFRLEERFAFNTTTQKLWWHDRSNGVLLG